MNEASRVKGTLSRIQEDDLQRPFLSAANILIDPEEVEIKTTAEADPELNDSLRPSSVQMAAALVEQVMVFHRLCRWTTMMLGCTTCNL